MILQIIDGISYATYQQDSDTYNAILEETIADCMTGINPQDITNFVVSSFSSSSLSASSRRLRSFFSIETTVTATNNNAIQTSYVVQSSDSSLTYASVSAQLTSAIDNGVFNDILNSNAQTAGATALEGCTSSVVTTVPIDNNTSSSSTTLSGGAIAGIVIGIVVGLGVLFAIGYYYFGGGISFFGPSNHGSSNPNNTNTRMSDHMAVELENIKSYDDNPIASKKLSSPLVKR